MSRMKLGCWQCNEGANHTHKLNNGDKIFSCNKHWDKVKAIKEVE